MSYAPTVHLGWSGLFILLALWLLPGIFIGWLIWG